jgi:hypothetical protein
VSTSAAAQLSAGAVDEVVPRIREIAEACGAVGEVRAVPPRGEAAVPDLVLVLFQGEVGMVRQDVLHAVAQAVALGMLFAEVGVAAAVGGGGDVAPERGDRLAGAGLSRAAQRAEQLQQHVVADVVDLVRLAAVARRPGAAELIADDLPHHRHRLFSEDPRQHVLRRRLRSLIEIGTKQRIESAQPHRQIDGHGAHRVSCKVEPGEEWCSEGNHRIR